MNEEVILNRILDDANDQSELLISDANAKIEQLKEDLREFDYEQNQKALAEIEQYKTKYEEQNESNLKFLKRKLVLEVKNDVIKELKQRAIDKINGYSKEEMLEFLNKVISEHAEKNEKLSFNLDGISVSDIKGLASVNKLNLTVEKNTSLEKGLLLSTDVYDKNLSIENLAYTNEKYAKYGELNYADASRAAVIDMRKDISENAL